MSAQVFTPQSWQPIGDLFQDGVNADRWYFAINQGQLWQRVAEGKKREDVELDARLESALSGCLHEHSEETY